MRPLRLPPTGRLLLVPGTGVVVAEAVAGERGMPRRDSDYASIFGGENLAAAIGGGLTGLAIVVLAASALVAANRSRFPNPRLRSWAAVCGLCGIIALDRPTEAEAAERMAAELDHRGSDGTGSFA